MLTTQQVYDIKKVLVKCIPENPFVRAIVLNSKTILDYEQIALIIIAYFPEKSTEIKRILLQQGENYNNHYEFDEFDWELYCKQTMVRG